MFYLREYPQFFAAVPVYYWPVLCWELFWHRRWCEAELARRGGIDTQMIVSVTWTGRIVVRFIGDAPAPVWQTVLTHWSSARGAASLSLSHCGWADFQDGAQALVVATPIKDVGLDFAAPLLDPG